MLKGVNYVCLWLVFCSSFSFSNLDRVSLSACNLLFQSSVFKACDVWLCRLPRIVMCIQRGSLTWRFAERVELASGPRLVPSGSGHE